jgi:hypothetical protein
LFGRFDAKRLLESGREHMVERIVREQVGGERTGGK